MTANTFLELPGGFKMPTVGYGCGQTKETFEKALEAALEAGYRHLDTAFVYGTEKVLGEVVKRWISSGKLKREDLFITSKLPAKGNRPEGVKKYLKQSLENLQLDYLDLYLIHSPFGVNDNEQENFPMKDGKIDMDKNTDLIATWKAMEAAQEQGLTKFIGISNFNTKQIQRILDNAKIPPANLQIELHIYNQQKELVDFCKARNIVVSAYSPMTSIGIEKFLQPAGQTLSIPNPLQEAAVKEIAQKHQKAEGQVLLRHLIQKGIAIISKSATPERIRQNIDIFYFALDESDVKALDALDKGAEGRIFNFLFFKGIEDHPEYPF